MTPAAATAEAIAAPAAPAGITPPPVETVAAPQRTKAPWWRTRKIIAVPGAIVLVLLMLSQAGRQAKNGPATDAPTASGRVAAADDHGDTAATATAVTLPATQSGTIAPATDLDVFRFAVRANQDVQVELRLGTLADGGVNVIGQSGEQLASESAVGTTKTVTLTYKVKDAGTYGVAVHGVRGSTGTYQVIISAR